MAQRGTRAVETDRTTWLEQKPHIIIATAGVQVYYKKLQSKDKTQWNYSQLKGTLTLGRVIEVSSMRHRAFMKVKLKRIGSNYQTTSPEVLSGHSNFQRTLIMRSTNPFSIPFKKGKHPQIYIWGQRWNCGYRVESTLRITLRGWWWSRSIWEEGYCSLVTNLNFRIN